MERVVVNARGRNEIRDLFVRMVDLEYEGHEKEWHSLLNLLRVPLCYFPALREALKQSRWRTADNPQGYVATVTYREATKMGLGTTERATKSTSLRAKPISRVRLGDGDADRLSLMDRCLYKSVYGET